MARTTAAETSITSRIAGHIPLLGVLRHYELGPDGAWRDGLLMDLLAEELA